MIELKEDHKPYAIRTPRTVPLPQMDKVKSELENMMKNGVITPVEEVTEWCSPIVVVPKSNGQLRICVDLTKLNECIKRPFYPIPKIETTLNSMTRAKFFTKLDANSGFWQISLHKDSQKLTTFLTPFGRFKFCKLPFGITSAPEFFQRCMNKILGDLPNTAVHMDDILVWGRSKEEHDRNVYKVLNRLRDIGMTLNRDKSEFGKTSIKYLGHILSPQGISVDPEKVSSILSMAPPTNVKELQRFNGMVNFFRKILT